MSNAPTAQPFDTALEPGAALGASTILRALFLACSWTWCIGMFLPVLLVRDFGWPGWVAFATPNVIGAMSVGFVFKSRGSAALTAHRHALAMRLFSVVTILFHVAFLAWILMLVFPWLVLPIGEITVGGITVVPASMGEGIGSVAIVALLFLIALMLSSMRTGSWMLGALAVYALSITLAFMAWTTSGTDVLALSPIAGDEPKLAIIGAAAVMALGFLACPHMDLTILRTRHELAGTAGTRAFVLGFGVFFLSMIVLTLAYAPRFLVGETSYFIVAHIAGQAVFTMSAHLRELRTGSIERQTGRGFPPLLLLTLLLAVVCLGAAWLSYTGQGQTMYELFLSPYGLIFPAYAWCVMVPHKRLTKGADWAQTRTTRIILFVVSSALASPILMYAAVGEPKRWIWAAAGVAVVVVAPLGLRFRVPWQRSALPR